MSINLDFEIAALVMQIFFYFLFGFQYGKKSRDCIYYKRMLIMLFLTTFTNIVVNIFNCFPRKEYIIIFLFISSLCSACGVVTIYYFYKYVIALYPPETARSKSEGFNRVLAGVHVLICLSNPFTGLMVRYDDDCNMLPGPFLLEMYLISAYFLMFALVKMHKIYRMMSKHQRIAVFAFMFLLVAGYGLQIVFGRTVQVQNFAVTIGIIILLYSIETPDYEKMIEATKKLKERENELEAARDELDNQTKIVHQMTKTAFWRLGFDIYGNSDKYEWSDEFLHMLHYEKNELTEEEIRNLWPDSLHPDDRKKSLDAFFRGMQGEEYREEFRLRDKEGEYHWFLGTGTCIYNNSGKLTSYQGVIRNIDDEKTREILSQERIEALEALEQSQSELKKALMQAEEASRAKTVFLSNMSHDIRTPMNAIVGFTNLALDHIDNTDEVRDCLFTIKNSGNHLLSLINDILDMSRIESGKVTVEPTRCDLLKIVNEIREMIQAGANEKGQTLNENHEGVRDRYVMVDRLRFNQIAINCLSNAVKFTPQKGTISIGVTQGETKTVDGKKIGSYIFSVEDTGIGMTPDFLKHIFEPFERAKNSTTNNVQGTGLGMAITKNLIDMMDGTIEIESKVNVGTKYVITLPLEIIDDYDEIEENQEAVYELTTDDMLQAFAGDTFLVVDDNALNRMIVKRLLSDRGLIIEEADSGQAAIKRVCDKEKVLPRLIFMDVMMPDMDGYQTTHIIRDITDEEISGLPIIAVTANAFEEDKRLAIENGMNAHVTKPFVLNELAKTIYTLLNREN